MMMFLAAPHHRQGKYSNWSSLASVQFSLKDLLPWSFDAAVDIWICQLIVQKLIVKNIYIPLFVYFFFVFNSKNHHTLPSAGTRRHSFGNWRQTSERHASHKSSAGTLTATDEVPQMMAPRPPVLSPNKYRGTHRRRGKFHLHLHLKLYFLFFLHKMMCSFRRTCTYMFVSFFVFCLFSQAVGKDANCFSITNTFVMIKLLSSCAWKRNLFILDHFKMSLDFPINSILSMSKLHSNVTCIYIKLNDKLQMTLGWHFLSLFFLLALEIRRI